MNTHRARVGLLGLVAFLGGLATAEDRRIIAADSARMAAAHAFHEATFLKHRPSGGTPFLRTASWTDVGPEGSFEGWVDSVGRRPRRSGVFTLLSYYEIVAVNVRVHVTSASPSPEAPRRDASVTTFGQLQRTGTALQEMTRDGSGREPGSRVNLAQTFLSGVVVEGFALEGPDGPRGGHFHSRVMRSGQAGEGWSLYGVQVDGADGRRLKIAEAAWTKDGRLIARGAYTVEKGPTTVAGPHGCFSIRLDGPLSFRRVSTPSAGNTSCAPALLVTRNESPSPTMPVVHRGGWEARVAWPMALLVQPLLHPFSTAPIPSLTGVHPDVSWRP